MPHPLLTSWFVGGGGQGFSSSIEVHAYIVSHVYVRVACGYEFGLSMGRANTDRPGVCTPIARLLLPSLQSPRLRLETESNDVSAYPRMNSLYSCAYEVGVQAISSGKNWYTSILVHQ